MPPFTMAYPVKMWGTYDGTDAKGRDIHFDDELYEGQTIGNARKSDPHHPAPPFGKVERQPNGEIWVVAVDKPKPKKLSTLQHILLDVLVRSGECAASWASCRAGEVYRKHVHGYSYYSGLPSASQGLRYVWTMNGIRNLKILVDRGFATCKRDRYGRDVYETTHAGNLYWADNPCPVSTEL